MRGLWKNVCYFAFLERNPGDFKTSRNWEIAAPEAECNNEAYMNLGYQSTLRVCAAICDLKRGVAFSYGIRGKAICKAGPCSCKCWYLCSGTKQTDLFHLYKFKNPQIGMYYCGFISNWITNIPAIRKTGLS